MQELKFKGLLTRYFNKKANETESALVDAWYKSYQSLEEDVQVETLVKEESKKALKSYIQQSESTKTLKPLYFKIAASVVLISATAIFFNKKLKSSSKKITYSFVSARVGQVKKVTLPDSSVVWLNAASNLRVSSNFNEETRTVFLDEGEAYFEVTKNPKKPFIVNSPKLKVQVLGTSFDIDAYRDKGATKVSVSTGRVKVKNANKNLAILTPKQELTFNNKAGDYHQTEIDINQFRAWKDGKFYFNQASFINLAVTLKNNFKIDLIAGKPEVKKYLFTLHLTSDMTNQQVLNLVSAIHDSNYRKEGNSMILY
ncbi:hypothetical protein A5893_11680 [Pedobacter psychrophilus]|uniref:Uncharacterized protein n=1 Tax=Pedobacter psychrophilus TaxID=1826909 RepID=A0A179DE50_9SPHI|nr:FecR family protein [Pedobacter psychrophilus]OAQ39316.1 hypothetical protein A5893_11680 [Pedobacter psychrophilus]